MFCYPLIRILLFSIRVNASWTHGRASSLIRGLFLPAHHGLHPEARRIEPDTRSIDPTLAVFVIHDVLLRLSYHSIRICIFCSRPGHGWMLRELKLRVILTCQNPQCN